MKRGVKASLAPMLDESPDLCYARAECTRQAEFEIKVERKSDGSHLSLNLSLNLSLLWR
jgi:hypothetical protein